MTDSAHCTESGAPYTESEATGALSEDIEAKRKEITKTKSKRKKHVAHRADLTGCTIQIRDVSANDPFIGVGQLYWELSTSFEEVIDGESSLSFQTETRTRSINPGVSFEAWVQPDATMLILTANLPQHANCYIGRLQLYPIFDERETTIALTDGFQRASAVVRIKFAWPPAPIPANQSQTLVAHASKKELTKTEYVKLKRRRHVRTPQIPLLLPTAAIQVREDN